MNFCFPSLSSYTPTFQDDSTDTSNIIVRTCQLEDLKGLAEVLTESFHPAKGLMGWITPILKLGIYEDLRSRLRYSSQQYICLVAVANHDTISKSQEEIVGTVELSLRSLSPWQLGAAQYPYISNLAVKPSYRRKGIADQLLHRCEQTCLEWGLSELYLHVLENNDRALPLYFKLGYQVYQVESGHLAWLFKSPGRFFLKKNLA